MAQKVFKERQQLVSGSDDKFAFFQSKFIARKIFTNRFRSASQAAMWVEFSLL
jgi:hypothetical protein